MFKFEFIAQFALVAIMVIVEFGVFVLLTVPEMYQWKHALMIFISYSIFIGLFVSIIAMFKLLIKTGSYLFN